VAQNKAPRRMAEKIVMVTSPKLIGLNAPLVHYAKTPRRLRRRGVGAAPERRSERSVFGRVDFYHDHMLVETTLYGKVVQRIEAELRKALQRGS